MKLPLLYRRQWWLIYLPIVAAVVGVLVWAATVGMPLPPPHVVIATGPPQSSYLRLAQIYAARLEHLGLRVDIVTHARPQDALHRLATPGTGLDVAFAQGLYARPDLPVQALATIGHEIVWVFAHTGIARLADLRGKRVAAAAPDSSNRLALELLLTHARIKPSDIHFVDLVGDAAVAALADSRVDAVVHVASGESGTVAALARMADARLLHLERAGALKARESRLRPVVIPQGSIELRSDIPPADITAAATQTHLLVRPDLHPALQRALLDVANEIHAMPGFLESQGHYPSMQGSDFALSPHAARFGQGVRPWLETLLRYRTAQAAQWVLFVFMPVFVLAMWLMRRVPRFIEWHVNAALQHFYGELKFLEADMTRLAASDPIALRWVMTRMEKLDKQIMELELPERYTDRWYTLREHLAAARERLHNLRER